MKKKLSYGIFKLADAWGFAGLFDRLSVLYSE